MPHKPVQVLRKQYALISGISCFVLTVSILLFSFYLDPEIWAYVMAAHLALLFFICFAAYLSKHYEMKRLKSQNQWSAPAATQRLVVDTRFRSQKLVYSSWWFIPHGFIILLTLGTGILLYDKFPDLLIMQYDLEGQVSRAVEKSYQGVLWPAATQFFLLSILSFVYYSIVRSKQQIDASDPETSMQRNVIFRRRWSGFILILGFLIISLMYFIQLNMLLQLSPIIVTTVPLVVIGVILAGTIWLSFSTGQGGSKLKINGQNTPSGKTNTDDDKYWKLGQIYFNPNDPTLFVEKRFGIGWTVNFARPTVWFIFLGILALVLLLIFFSP